MGKEQGLHSQRSSRSCPTPTSSEGPLRGDSYLTGSPCIVNVEARSDSPSLVGAWLAYRIYKISVHEKLESQFMLTRLTTFSLRRLIDLPYIGSLRQRDNRFGDCVLLQGHFTHSCSHNRWLKIIEFSSAWPDLVIVSLKGLIVLAANLLI